MIRLNLAKLFRTEFTPYNLACTIPPILPLLAVMQ